MDRFGRTVSLVQVVSTDAETLAAQYPEYATQIMPQNRWQQGSPSVSLVRYHDKDQDLIFLPERQNLLANVPNPVGKCLANVAMRSSLDGEARGQFDDILSVQLARARFAVLQDSSRFEKSVRHLLLFHRCTRNLLWDQMRLCVLLIHKVFVEFH